MSNTAVPTSSKDSVARPGGPCRQSKHSGGVGRRMANYRLIWTIYRARLPKVNRKEGREGGRKGGGERDRGRKRDSR